MERQRKPLRSKVGLSRRKGVNAISARRRGQLPDRHRCREIVIDRDRGCVAEGIAGVPHGQIPGHAMLEVNELKRGSMRAQVYLDPDWCIALCPVAHGWVTGHPVAAQVRGLQLPSHATAAQLAESAEIRDGWRHGTNPTPSWLTPETMQL